MLTALPWTLELDFPASFNALLDATDWANLDLVRLVPLACVADVSFVRELLLTCNFPLGVICALWLGYFAFVRGNKALPLEKRLRIRALVTQIALVGSYLVYPAVSSKVFRALRPCLELDEKYGGSRTWFRDDFSLPCDSSRYEFMRAFAVLMVFVWPFGVPAVYFSVLYRHRAAINPPGFETMEAAVEARDADERIKIYGFLFEVYEPEYMFFECFEAVRRLSLTGLMVVVQPGTAFQCVVGWAIATLSIKIIATTRPFVDDADDALTEAAMWSIMLVFFGALLIRVDVEGDSDAMRDAMGATLVVVTVLPVVIGLVTVLYSARLAHVAEPEEQPSDGAIITDNPMLSQQARASFFEREGGVELKQRVAV